MARILVHAFKGQAHRKILLKVNTRRCHHFFKLIGKGAVNGSKISFPRTTNNPEYVT